MLLILSHSPEINLFTRVHSVDEMLPRVKMRCNVFIDALEGDCYIQKSESRASEAGRRCLLHPKIGMLEPRLRYVGRATDRNCGAAALGTLSSFKVGVAHSGCVESCSFSRGFDYGLPWPLEALSKPPWPQVSLWFFFFPWLEG